MSSVKKALSDKSPFIPGSPKVNFVGTVEQKIVEIITAEEITGELMKYFCGPRDRPIFIRPFIFT